MKNSFILIWIILTVQSDACSEKYLASFEFIGNSKIYIASKEHGQELISSYDPYIERLSKFDLYARM